MNTSEALRVLSPLCDSTEHAKDVLNEVIKAIGIEVEWAVAEFDSVGRVIQVSHQDWSPEPVERSLEREQQRIRSLESNGISFDGSVGLVTRGSSPWTG